MNIDAAPSRLNFVAAARSAFAFLLESPFAFWLTDQDEESVGYESEDIVLVVFHDRLSYELGVHLWRLSSDDEAQRPYTLSELMRVTNTLGARSYRRFAATSVDAVRRGTEKLASELREYGDPALKGNQEFFVRLAASRSDAIQELGREMEDRKARQQAEEAWVMKDYAAVITAYSLMEGRLSRVEEARLRLSRERSVG